MTAATLAVSRLASRALIPRRWSMPIRLSRVNGALLRSSPVPLRPTTRPYPTNRLSRTPFEAADVLDPGLGMALARPGGGQQQHQQGHGEAETHRQAGQGLVKVRVFAQAPSFDLGSRDFIGDVGLCETRANRDLA